MLVSFSLSKKKKTKRNRTKAEGLFLLMDEETGWEERGGLKGAELGKGPLTPAGSLEASSPHGPTAACWVSN